METSADLENTSANSLSSTMFPLGIHCNYCIITYKMSHNGTIFKNKGANTLKANHTTQQDIMLLYNYF